VVEVRPTCAWVAWVLNAYADAFEAIPDGVVFSVAAVRRQNAASAAVGVPVVALTASVDASRRSADAVADVFIPVVAGLTEVWMAEAAAL